MVILIEMRKISDILNKVLILSLNFTMKWKYLSLISLNAQIRSQSYPILILHEFLGFIWFLNNSSTQCCAGFRSIII